MEAREGIVSPKRKPISGQPKRRWAPRCPHCCTRPNSAMSATIGPEALTQVLDVTRKLAAPFDLQTMLAVLDRMKENLQGLDGPGEES